MTAFKGYALGLSWVAAVIGASCAGWAGIFWIIGSAAHALA